MDFLATEKTPDREAGKLDSRVNSGFSISFVFLTSKSPKASFITLPVGVHGCIEMQHI